MKKLLQIITSSNRETKWFALMGLIYAIALILSTVYVYMKIDFRSGLVEVKPTTQSKHV